MAGGAQTDATGEERHRIGGQRRRERRVHAAPPDTPELEDVRILQKEIALLRKEQPETRQVDLPIVDFRRGKIRVQRQRCVERRCEFVENVERRLHFRNVAPWRETAPLVGGQGWHDVEAETLLDIRDTCEFAGNRRALRPVSRDPAHGFIVAGDPAIQVEAPHVGVRVERDRLERNPRLDNPAIVPLRGLGLPDTAPLPLDLVGALEQPFLSDAVRVDLETIAVSLVVEGVEKDVELVVEPRVVAALAQHLGGHEFRLIVFHVRGQIQRLLVVEHEEARPLGRLRILDGQDLVNVLGLDRCGARPGRLVEPPVEDDRFIRAGSRQYLRRRAFLGESREGAGDCANPGQEARGWREPTRVSNGSARMAHALPTVAPRRPAVAICADASKRAARIAIRQPKSSKRLRPERHRMQRLINR